MITSAQPATGCIFVELPLFTFCKAMKNSFLKQVVTVFVSSMILFNSGLSILPTTGAAQTNTAAKQMADRLHEVFEKNLGFKHLQKLYDSLSCVNQDVDASKLLHSITDPAAVRFNASVRVLKDLITSLQQVSSETKKVNIASCCRGLNDTSGSFHFSDKLRSLVDLSTGCSIRQSALQSAHNNSRLNNELLNGFKRNFNKSLVVAWQYYGSIDGEYLQYPASKRYCDGNTSSFDPRFKSWYVETASPVNKNLVIIIDRSGSMSGTRMRLAIDAALTVLDTLSPQDNVGILAFSHRIQTPSGCFGTTVAAGIPANLAKLKDWVRELRALGSTYYAPAFKHAFAMFQNVTRDQGSERTNIILFLTDGNPNDADKAQIYQEIEEGQERLNMTVQINTYALGVGISSNGLKRLQIIASNNSGVFFEIRDQHRDVLKRIMGSYYTSIKSPLGQEPRLSVPYIDSRLGVVVTMSLALTQNGSFRGVLAMDLPLEHLFKEALQVSSSSLSYAILVDKEGRTILHPSLPGPTDTTSSRSFLPLSLFETGLPPDVTFNITSGDSGHQRVNAGFPVPLGDQSKDGAHLFHTNATYLWSPVGNSAYSIVLVVADGQSVTTDLTSFKDNSQISSSFYHRLDLVWNYTASHPDEVCSLKENILISPISSTVKIAPLAFNDSDEYVYGTETLEDVQDIQRFFNDNTSQARYKGLSEAVHSEVILTSELEDIWRRADFTSPDEVTWRFVGTKQGVLRTYPGLRLQKTYSHRQQSWYRQAASSPETLVVSLRTSAYEQDRMLSFSKAILKTSCEGSQLGDLLAVMGMEMTESAFLQLITNNVDLNEDTNMTWYVLERSGHIVLNFSSSTILQPYKKHLTEVIPWLANELIKKEKSLKASWCNDYQQHAVEMFYELLDFNGASSNSSDPCRQFTLSPVQGTSLFLLGLPSRNEQNCLDRAVAPNEDCFCGKFCDVCSSDVMLNCQCPYSCHMSYDECDNSVTRLWTSLPCPVPAPPLFDTEKEEKALKEALATVPRCARDCLKVGNITECQKTVGCHWCLNEESPSCSSECRTGQSLSMHVLFPCQNLMNLSTVQQNSLKYLFKEALIRLVKNLSTLNIDHLHLQKDGFKFRLYGTTSNSDLKTLQESIQRLVKQDKIVLGPVVDLPEIYAARSPEHFTDLHIVLTLDQALPQTSQEMSANVETQMQSILVTLLGGSHVSGIRCFNLYNETSVQLSLSNEGEIDRYPIHKLQERLEAAVTTGQVFFNVPFVPGEAVAEKILVTKMSAGGGFDFLCHPFTSTPQTTQHFYSSTEWIATTSATYTEKEREKKQGLTPVEIAVVVTASVLTASSCPCILFILLTKRRSRTRKGKVRPDGGPDEDPPSELSDLSEIDADMNIAVNRAYSTYEPTRIQLTPREAWARAKQLTIPAPKNIPEGAWF